MSSMAKAVRYDTWCALVVSMGVLTAAVWWWQHRVIHARLGEVKDEAWGRVKEVYPLPLESATPMPVSAGTVEAIIHANPFSQKRRAVSPPSGAERSGETGEGASEAPPKPQFIYMGRINVGSHQRGIIQDTVGHKTYFLEVGQEVAGFKVLDIAENRVLLSDLTTHEEVVVAVSSTSPH